MYLVSVLLVLFLLVVTKFGPCSRQRQAWKVNKQVGLAAEESDVTTYTDSQSHIHSIYIFFIQAQRYIKCSYLITRTSLSYKWYKQLLRIRWSPGGDLLCMYWPREYTTHAVNAYNKRLVFFIFLLQLVCEQSSIGNSHYFLRWWEVGNWCANSKSACDTIETLSLTHLRIKNNTRA